jgi:glutamate 5-kinase
MCVGRAHAQGRLMRMYDDFFSSLDQPIAQVLLTRENLAAEHHCALCVSV